MATTFGSASCRQWGIHCRQQKNNLKVDVQPPAFLKQQPLVTNSVK
jgi:hypothetical protein